MCDIMYTIIMITFILVIIAVLCMLFRDIHKGIESTNRELYFDKIDTVLTQNNYVRSRVESPFGKIDHYFKYIKDRYIININVGENQMSYNITYFDMSSEWGNMDCFVAEPQKSIDVIEKRAEDIYRECITREFEKLYPYMKLKKFKITNSKKHYHFDEPGIWISKEDIKQFYEHYEKMKNSWIACDERSAGFYSDAARGHIFYDFLKLFENAR